MHFLFNPNDREEVWGFFGLIAFIGCLALLSLTTWGMFLIYLLIAIPVVLLVLWILLHIIGWLMAIALHISGRDIY